MKGRSGKDCSVMLSKNEMNRLAQLADAAQLYIVINCKYIPELHIIQKPAKNLEFLMKNKGIRYFSTLEEWQRRVYYTNAVQ